ncbi:hypothetical protein [Rhodoferax sp.]|uniref:hypothetical protein n=1 Tax=Rhodoferax sp. TaxID=50421 RepID=UPI0025FCD76F|nr:hypothetical protein [Rhodoferax sp.]
MAFTPLLRYARFFALWLLLCGAAMAQGTVNTLQVGPQRTIKTIAAAARLAGAGATIEVDAGEYVGDVAVWTQPNLTLRAVGGRVRLRANGVAAEDKAIWVVRSPKFTVEGFDFEGVQVAGRNGAGIRFESGWLVVRNCSFTHNEMGLLTSNDPNAVLEVENSEFAYNMRPDGHNHNLYIGQIARATITGSYLHHARTGHLLKSRAAISQILYNRLTDDGGSASYELEFPNGGVAVVVGNTIQQGPLTENPVLISFGAEGYAWPFNQLSLAYNTLVDDLPSGGIWLRVKPGADAVLAVNNLLIGTAPLRATTPGDFRNNFNTDRSSFAPGGEYRLRAGSPLVGKAITLDKNLQAQREYSHTAKSIALGIAPHNPGAMQLLQAPRP